MSSSTTWMSGRSSPRSKRRGRWARVALFGEKYGDQVRVVEVGDYSRELCGGPTSRGPASWAWSRILASRRSALGVRRVEALVGTDAFRFLATESVLVSQLTEQLKVRRDELPERVAAAGDPAQGWPSGTLTGSARPSCSARRRPGP